MPIQRYLVLSLVLFSFASTCVAQSAPQAAPYRDAKLPVEKRVADLLSRMTLEEKVAQLQAVWQNRDIVKEEDKFFISKERRFLPERARALVKDGLGQMARPSEKLGPREMAEFTNAVQRFFVENTRLGIPVLFHEECLHGHAAPRGTAYPQAIALASSWDVDLVERVFAATAKEVRARGAHQCLTPVLDLARDPRWGRTEETYGEDVYLVSRLGVAATRGFQGPGPQIGPDRVIATAKHFAVHGSGEAGVNISPGNYSERVIRNDFLTPFEVAVKEAKIASVMACYNEVDGIPCHASPFLLDQILRKEWGFEGTLVSDYFAIEQLSSVHKVVADKAQAAKISLESGVDVELPYAQTFDTLVQQVRSGKLAESMIDRAVTRVLQQKFELGLFDRPYSDPALAEKVTNSPEHRALALESARKSIILLKNDKNLLPLDRTRVKHIAVVGPNAASVHLGGYSDNPGRGVSVLDGIRDKVGAGVKVSYAEGCRITESNPDWNADVVVPADPAKDEFRIREAEAVAKTADVVVIVVGENEQTSREAWSDNHLGDRDSLDLLGRQDELVRRVLATGKPTIVVLLHGRPNSINFIAENVPAILDGWYLGQEGGTAVADVLFGDYNPAGRLPITIPRSVGQVPAYYSRKPSSQRPFLFTGREPLFAFGHGLSYTTFAYANLRVAPEKVASGEYVTVRVDVTNTGKRAGEEVVQLYLRDEVSSVTRPVKELRGFRRVKLEPGETRTVEFTLGSKDLAFIGPDMKWTVEPGMFTLSVGPSLKTVLSASFEVN